MNKISKQLPHLTSRLVHRPWLAMPHHVHSLHQMLEQYKAGTLLESYDDEDDDTEAKVMETEGSLAYIPITGTIGNNIGSFRNMCFDVVDVRDIKTWIDKSMRDSNIKTIFLDVNSPGGEATYVHEVATLIASAAKEKDVIAYCNDYMASAAYYLAAGATEIWVHPASSAIGSIGVYCALIDEYEAYKMAGYEVKVVSAGKYKAEGMPGTRISDEYRELLQMEVAKLYDAFAGHVRQNRSKVNLDEIGALTFVAQDALDRGLIDYIVENPMDNLYSE